MVLILMATYNGERFIRKQLDSIAAQTHRNWKLAISDDGSTDQTLEIVRQWASEVGEGRVELREGPRKGFAQNFLSMACDPNLRADFYAFADQDDVWLEQKLHSALKWVREKEGQNRRTLYCGRTTYVTADLKYFGLSPLFQKPPSFKNAIAQCLAGGNTMVFNQETKELLKTAGPVPVVSHDWWVYQLVTGSAGLVFYDPQPQVLYRQHKRALKGENISFIANLKRAYKALAGGIKEHNDQNLKCLFKSIELLSLENKNIILQFSEARGAPFFKRMTLVYHLGIYRQARLETLVFALLAVLRKI